MIEEADVCLTFSDEDFERRYSSEKSSGAADPTRSAASAANPPAAQIGRSRNRLMRTLLRRRLAASGRA